GWSVAKSGTGATNAACGRTRIALRSIQATVAAHFTRWPWRDAPANEAGHPCVAGQGGASSAAPVSGWRPVGTGDAFHRVAACVGVFRHEYGPLADRLGNEQMVERVAMMRRQLGQRQQVRWRDVQHGEA